MDTRAAFEEYKTANDALMHQVEDYKA